MDLKHITLLAAALTRLPAELREPLLLARIDGLSYDEIGSRLDLTSMEVERRIARALARLDRELERMNWHEWRQW